MSTAPTTSANLAANLPRTASEHPDRPAIVLDERRMSYAELDAAAGLMATWLLGQGIGAGDRVALMLPNLPSFPVVYYGALRIGAVVVPMNPLFKKREIAYYLQDSGARLIVTMPGEEVEAAAEEAGVPVLGVGPEGFGSLLDGLEPTTEVSDRAGSDTAVILYTSGTTGAPKGAELTHDNLQTNQRTTRETLLDLTPDDVVMGCLPLFHVFGMTCGLNTAVAAGACLTLIPRFDPAKALEVIPRDGVTVFEGVPTMYSALLAAAGEADVDLSSLRAAISGGASLPVQVMRTFEERFGCIILEGYGLSETSPVASFNHPDAERRPGSIGTPVRGVEMRLVDAERRPLDAGEGADPEAIGEIAIRGENIMAGYWGQPEATAEAVVDGWFHSGDLARRDADGYFFIVDRTKDMILRGGMNVYPREVEEVLYEHPAVAEAAVVGVPHADLGEEIAAYVVLKADAGAEPQELSGFVRERLASYKYPRHVHLIDALPKGATGKILKRELGSG